MDKPARRAGHYGKIFCMTYALLRNFLFPCRFQIIQFFAQFLQNFSAGGGLVPQHVVAGAAFEFVQQFLRKTVRVGGQSAGEEHTHQFPVPGD